MHIAIIVPGHPSHRRWSFPPALTAPYLAALATPHARTIKIYDLAVQTIDARAPTPDLALVSTTTPQSDHVFEIAQRFKARGVPLILGGPHASLAYAHDRRIQQIFDSVVIGEGEKALPQALRDLSRGKLRPLYDMPVEALTAIPYSRLDLLDRRKYIATTAVFGTRGCPHSCRYCVIKDIYRAEYLKRPVDEIIEEIRFQTRQPGLGWLGRKLITFWDDNMAGDIHWFHDLLAKLIPLKKWWISQMCLNVADNKESLRLLKASGCKGLLVGLESTSRETLRAQNKARVNIIDDYRRQAHALLAHGINFMGTLMYGFDQDTRESLFEITPRILDDMGLTLLHTHIVTPYPHSAYFDLLQRENRLLTHEAKYYNGYTIVHAPKNIAPLDLQTGMDEARRRFYSLPSARRRLARHKWFKVPEFFLWNLLYRKPNHGVIPGVCHRDWVARLKREAGQR